MLGYRGAELLDMDAYLRVDAAYAYWCKVRRSLWLVLLYEVLEYDVKLFS